MSGRPINAVPSVSPSELAQWPGRVASLVDALKSERRLLEDLISAMRKQREAVAADDFASVDDSVFGVQRILLTLGEARKRRRTLYRRFGQRADITLGDLFDVLGPFVTEDLRASRDALQRSARILARDIAVNRQVLHEALGQSEDPSSARPREWATTRTGARNG